MVPTALDLNIFQLLIDSPGPLTSAEISNLVPSGRSLVATILASLASLGFVDGVGVKGYRANSNSRHIVRKSVSAGMRVSVDLMDVDGCASTWYKQHGYNFPVTDSDTPFQLARGTNLQYFDYMKQDPESHSLYNDFMSGMFGAPQRQHWTSWYPVEARILQGYESDVSATVFVDVGGGRGHDTQALLNRFPRAAELGNYVVQDLHVPQDGNLVHCGFESLVHDFRKPQPIKGMFR